MQKPDKKDYDFNCHWETLKFASDMQRYANHLEEKYKDLVNEKMVMPKAFKKREKSDKIYALIQYDQESMSIGIPHLVRRSKVVKLDSIEELDKFEHTIVDIKILN